ncbi:MAG: Gfo/Idh/MocA family oxidoreductase [Anaerolineaceae bacterium]|nr:Gfo/Idh/MocA family oxidoreductase [Anaerolineaceae bacterium]
MSEQKTRVAVIGLGPIGNRHTRIHLRHPDVEVVGVCDIDEDRANAAAAAYGVPAFYDAKRMFDKVGPEIVSVATGGYEYGSDHYKPTMEALEAGCHVLCEKPISNEIWQAEEMVAKAKEKNLCFGIDLNHRFTPAARQAKKWQNDGRLGHLLFVNMSMWIMNPRESSPWFQIKALHPHTVDIMRHFCGDVEAVQCFVTHSPYRTIWTTAQFNMQFKNGVVGSLTGSYEIERGHPMERTEVAGTGGRFVIDDMWREATLYPAGNLLKEVYTNPVFDGYRDFEDTFQCRIHTFVDQVRAGVAPADIDGSGEDGLKAQKVLAAAIESVVEKKIVYLDN